MKMPEYMAIGSSERAFTVKHRGQNQDRNVLKNE